MLEDPASDTYKTIMASLRRIPAEPDGTLVNTFESLEARAVAALRDPRCVPGQLLPPVYCVGPFVGSVGGAEAAEPRRHECLTWLDGQPDRSVVFLCFGGIGEVVHSEEQLREIAVGLEESGHRFLWVVRAPSTDADLDLGAFLPDGFLERTHDRGLVVKSWAPQVDVLRHRATGAFVMHCGWNSVLEGITAGVPMLCWPLYSEQKMNKLLMVEEMSVGVEMAGWQHGLVKAGEVEAKVRLVMESEEGRELMARVVAHKEGAAVACNDGGSSRLAFARFLADMDSRQDQACSGAASDV
jgi:UDP:flavonoid glycosyltransferase YjiC (YdhE family)